VILQLVIQLVIHAAHFQVHVIMLD
jgi:hypothetical protein